MTDSGVLVRSNISAPTPRIYAEACAVCSGPLPDVRPRVTVYCLDCGPACCSRICEPCSEACAIRYTEGGIGPEDDCCNGGPQR